MATGLTATAIDALLRKLAALPLLGAQLVGRAGPPVQLDVAVGTAPTEVPHPLGSVPRMVVLGPPNVSSVVFMPVAPTRTTITLQATVACTVRSFVFLPGRDLPCQTTPSE